MDGLVLFGGLLARCLGKPGRHRIEQLVHAAAMLGAERKDVESGRIQLAEVERLLAPVGVDLVRGDEHRLSAPAQKLCELAIRSREALHRVDDEDDRVRLAHRRLCLLADGADQLLIGAQRETPGVDDAEALRSLLRFGVLPIPRHPGHVLDDGEALPHDPVEEG